MVTNARGQTVMAGTGEPVTRARINGLLDDVMDIRPVASLTARAQLVADLTADGKPPSQARPLYVHRADAPTVRRLEVNEGDVWKPVSPAGGPASGTTNAFGQIAITHGLGYKPTYFVVSMASAIAVGDPLITESAARDFGVSVWDVAADVIVIRFMDLRTNAWAGPGGRFGVMWSAK